MKVSPRRCVFLFGVPTSESEYKASLKLSGAYSSQFLGGWTQFNWLWVRDVDRFKSRVGLFGSAVFSNTTLGLLKDTFKGGLYDSVILISHWSSDGLELGGAFVDFKDVAESIPSTYAGVLDLCVCHPQPLVEAVYESNPQCLIRYIPHKAKPDLWLLYYQRLLAILSQGEEYDVAMKKLTIAILKVSPR